MKVPPSINQFKRTLDKNQASELFKLLVKYQPETKDAKQNRLEDAAKATAAGEATPTSPPPPTLKYGLKHVTTLIEQKKAKLVVIPHDVDPIELVLWVPALCRKMGIPFAIVKGKSRLGRYPKLTHKKTICSTICLTTVYYYYTTTTTTRYPHPQEDLFRHMSHHCQQGGREQTVDSVGKL